MGSKETELVVVEVTGTESLEVVWVGDMCAGGVSCMVDGEGITTGVEVQCT